MNSKLKDRFELQQSKYMRPDLQNSFDKVQRLLWEKKIYPNRFRSTASFRCITCKQHTMNLSFCLECGNVFCLKHGKCHNCKVFYGVDIRTQMLFIMENNQRKFVFDPDIDRRIIASKFAVIDNLPLVDKIPIDENILPFPRIPSTISNITGCSIIISVTYCLLSSIVLQKWFLSYPVEMQEIKSPRQLIHALVTNLFTSVGSTEPPDFAPFLTAITRVLSVDMEPHELYSTLIKYLASFYAQIDQDLESKFCSLFTFDTITVLECAACHQKIYEQTKSPPTIAVKREDFYGPTPLTQALECALRPAAKICHNNDCKGYIDGHASLGSVPPFFAVSPMPPEGRPVRPESSLDIGPLTGSRKPLPCKLFAFVSREAGGGYTARIKLFGHWLLCAPGGLSRMGDEALDADPMIMFYAREDLSEL